MSARDLDECLGEKIGTARVCLKLTEYEAAALLDVSVEEYVLLEAGKVRIDAQMVSKISIAFDRPISWFFTQ